MLHSTLPLSGSTFVVLVSMASLANASQRSFFSSALRWVGEFSLGRMLISFSVSVVDAPVEIALGWKAGSAYVIT